MSSRDAEPLRSRPRANTNFSSFFHRRPKPGTELGPSTDHEVATAEHIPSVDELIESLMPPTQPSIQYARSLAKALISLSPLPPLSALQPVLAALCPPDSPNSLQAAGFDILSSYLENDECPPLSVLERRTLFDLLVSHPDLQLWAPDLWEPRFKALRSLTKYGKEVLGVETKLISSCKAWIQEAFDGLDLGEKTERSERERSIELFSDFLTGVIGETETLARLTDDELDDILHFYSSLLIHAIEQPALPEASHAPPTASSPSRPSPKIHKRSASSVSVPSLSSPGLPPSPPVMITNRSAKTPFDVALALYLKHLSAQAKSLGSEHLDRVFPVLFRALSFCASPLPRLSLNPRLQGDKHRAQRSSEDILADALNDIFSGPYSSVALGVLRKHLYPPSAENDLPDDSSIPSSLSTPDMLIWLQTSLGAHRTLRMYIRRALYTRLARAYISREATFGYSHSGAPGHMMDLEGDLMERAWGKDDISSASTSRSGASWDPGRLGRFLSGSVFAWVSFSYDPSDPFPLHEGKERIVEEAAGTLRDILQEVDSREEDTTGLEDGEATAIGETLFNLAGYVLPLRNPDGTPHVVPLSHPASAQTPLLSTICSLLSREHTTSFEPLLSITLISIADHLSDEETARLPSSMMAQHDLTPTSPDWLENWQAFFNSSTLLNVDRPKTREAFAEALCTVFDGLRDMPKYRQPLAHLVLHFCQTYLHKFRESRMDGCHLFWGVIADELVMRIVDREDDEGYLDVLLNGASLPEEEDDDTVSIFTTDNTQSQIPQAASAYHTPSAASPILSRMHSEYPGKSMADSGLPSVMSILSSFATGNTSRSQSVQPIAVDEPSFKVADFRIELEQPQSVWAAAGLINVFCQLSFTPHALTDSNLERAFAVFNHLTLLLKDSQSVRVRLTVLQFLMRLRADRDHRLYFAENSYDPDSEVVSLAHLVGRSRDAGLYSTLDIGAEQRLARSRVPERDGRLPARGRGAPSRHLGSRSRSRTTPSLQPTIPSAPQQPLWRLPERLPFTIADTDIPSEGVVTYDVSGPDEVRVLPFSDYLDIICDILSTERDWEILSYVLCHLPVQLSNKHLFCGPKSRDTIHTIVTNLCIGILQSELGKHIEQWPPGIKARDAQGLAYHTLSVLVSYRRCLDTKQRHLLVEVFQQGLGNQPATIRCCLHALSLAAFELQSSTTKFMSAILEKLSQIMSNPDNTVDILNFLSIVGSLPPLYANFTESDFKMVFGVALQYLQHHNRMGSSLGGSWALSQHVRILSYYVLYVWFLAVKLPDRPSHIPFITRQLLLANEGNQEVDDSTEVCFDWLARYTYASADPRPATSLLGNIVMNSAQSSEIALSEKTWLLGNSVVTIRTLARRGWIEVLSRRPSGYTKFICRVENAPMVGPGDVDPDLTSAAAFMLMERQPPTALQPGEQPEAPGAEPLPLADHVILPSEEEQTPRPDPITGYVWSGSAPSQRRKEVAIDPAFFALQLSAYPERLGPSQSRMPVDPSTTSKFFASLDRVPVIDTHKVGIMYVAPGQTNEQDILRNTHGSPAYTRFLEGIGRLINLRGQADVYAGGLDPGEDGEYAYAWWDDIGQLLYHTATMMPLRADDIQCNYKKRHIGNDYVRIVWNDSGIRYRFDTLSTQFQFVNIVIEPHSLGAIAAFSNNMHEIEYFKVTVQRAQGMTPFTPVGAYKLISAENLPLLIRQLSLLADWFASTFAKTAGDTERVEMKTNWQGRLDAIRRFRTMVSSSQKPAEVVAETPGVLGQEPYRDFTSFF